MRISAFLVAVVAATMMACTRPAAPGTAGPAPAAATSVVTPVCDDRRPQAVNPGSYGMQLDGSFRHPFLSPLDEENPHPFPTSPPVSKPLTMALAAGTKSVVAQYDFPDEDVNKSVKEFLRQLGK